MKLVQRLSAFTLIELLVVISVIGILAALLLANFAGIRDRADDSRVKSNLKQLQSAMRLRYNDTGFYGSTATVALNETHLTAAFVSVYADRNLLTGIIGLEAWGSNDQFVACARLTNTNDREREVASGKCSAALTAAGGNMPNVTTNPHFCVCAN